MRVIVQLKTQSLPEGWLADTSKAIAQRGRIARAQDRLLDRMAVFGASGIKRFRHIPFLAMEVDAVALSALLRDPDVLRVQEDVAVPPLEAAREFDGPSYVPSPAAGSSSSVSVIGAPGAWSTGYGGLGHVSVVIDTGVDKDHTFLSGKVLSEACYSSNTSSSTSLCPGGVESSIADGSGTYCDLSVAGCDHGTHVAGIVAGRGQDLNGVARDAGLIAIQVFSRFEGPIFCGEFDSCVLSYRSDQIRALERVYALRDTYPIASVNMSLGGGGYSDVEQCDLNNAAVKAAIDNLRSVGIATVIAAGNNGFTNALSAPACISTAVSVGSTNNFDFISSFSNEAPSLSLYAPGEAIVSSVPLNAFSTKSGTSMATPHVAGAWAILKQKAPLSDVDRILASLRSTGMPLTSEIGTWTTPRIQVDAALDAVIQSKMAVDRPTADSSVTVPFTAEGWAIDTAATTGVGVNGVEVWAEPSTGGPPLFLGEANLDGNRPDVGAVFGEQFTPSAFGLTVTSALPEGLYVLRVLARLTATGSFDEVREVSVQVARPLSDARMNVEHPINGGSVFQPFRVAGWAIDRAASTGTGVDTVHVWAYPDGGGPPVFVGATTPNLPRPDVGAAFGAQFEASGFDFSVDTRLSPGSYSLVVYARSTTTATFNNSRIVRVAVGAASDPVMDIEAPADGANVTVPFEVTGWAIDRAAPSGTGVDTVHLWANPEAGGSPIFLGAASMGISRPDIAAVHGSQFLLSGFALAVTSGLPPGAYNLVGYAHSSVINMFNDSAALMIVVSP